MESSLRYASAALAVAFAVLFGALVGPNWTLDAISMAVLALVVLVLFFPKVDPYRAIGGFFGVGMVMQARAAAAMRNAKSRDRAVRQLVSEAPRPPTSRIIHYARMSKMADEKFARTHAEGPFERKLLENPDWRRLSDAELMEVAASAESGA